MRLPHLVDTPEEAREYILELFAQMALGRCSLDELEKDILATIERVVGLAADKLEERIDDLEHAASKNQYLRTLISRYGDSLEEEQ